MIHGQSIEVCQDGHVISRIVPDFSEQYSGLSSLLDGYRQIFVISDREVVKTSVLEPVFSGILNNVPVLEVDANEQNKSMNTVLEICGWMLENGADRDALVLGIGGGIVLDMAGFAASIYKRGVRFAYVPTTLLAQVDAGIGGKTGVNFDKYKNILGVIRQPEFSYLNVNVLRSLSGRDFLSGAAEMLKTFIIEDNGNYGRAIGFIHDYVNNGAVLGSSEMEELGFLVAASASVKAGVVSRDQFESGERRKLNLGHTFAHAIETLCRRKVEELYGSGEKVVDRQWDITHGEAVAIGIVMAARLAEGLGKSENGLTERLINDFKSCGLPVECPFGVEEMSFVMSKDKKSEGSIVHFVLPLSVGHVVIEDLSIDQAINHL